MQTTKQNKHVVSLCGDCGDCPSVALSESGAEIGEIGDPTQSVKLAPEVWNELVDKVQSGTLTKISAK